MKMIDELNVNQKVGEIGIGISNTNPINEQIIRIMINNYKNVYNIYVIDITDSVDNSIHNLIK